jgi:hypothetical protein
MAQFAQMLEESHRRRVARAAASHFRLKRIGGLAVSGTRLGRAGFGVFAKIAAGGILNRWIWRRSCSQWCWPTVAAGSCQAVAPGRSEDRLSSRAAASLVSRAMVLLELLQRRDQCSCRASQPRPPKSSRTTAEPISAPARQPSEYQWGHGFLFSRRRASDLPVILRPAQAGAISEPRRYLSSSSASRARRPRRPTPRTDRLGQRRNQLLSVRSLVREPHGVAGDHDETTERDSRRSRPRPQSASLALPG